MRVVADCLGGARAHAAGRDSMMHVHFVRTRNARKPDRAEQTRELGLP